MGESHNSIFCGLWSIQEDPIETQAKVIFSKVEMEMESYWYHFLFLLHQIWESSRIFRNISLINHC